jgi:TRAP-type C4-dicarboxylate transport system permease small subunit
VATLALSAVVIGTDVVLRYVFNAPLSWGIEATSLLLLVMVFGSLPYVWERGGHIRMELIYSHLNGVPRVFADVATALSGGLFSAALCFEMLRTFPGMRARHEGAENLGVPFWPFAVFVAVIAGLMTLQFVVFAVHSLVRGRG